MFEGNYHYGVGALANSLYYHGFRGIIWVGYRGELPPWAQPINKYGNYHEYFVADSCMIRFIKLETDDHFTNYKPNLMLRLWKEFCPDIEALFYFDPDIVIKCRWSYFEEWVTYGVALCEDVNSPVPNSHPLRMAWRNFYELYGYIFNSSVDIYVNGGFIGVKNSEKEFLENWCKIQGLMSSSIGGLNNANIKDRTFMFNKTDQDALNITLMSNNLPISLMGKEAMDIIYGGFTMSHALGAKKPWKGSTIFQVIKGKKPRQAEKEYWKYTLKPIKLYSKLEFIIRKIELKISSFLGRFIAN
ncbi:hypothetical protein DSM107007_11270 [Nostoc sp. PCC 7120 = FACHB-418]|nr:hypothetical protein DSM107007_11270 [Nostoc sp. PCC 7120 = FACHB-418]